MENGTEVGSMPPESVVEASAPRRERSSPTTPAEYDLVVIGGGSGGLGMAGFVAKVGLRTLLIDRSDRSIGGDCLNHGCVPSKALIHVANMIHQARSAAQFGVDLSGDVDMERVKGYIRAAQEVIRKHENAGHLRDQGMDVALGNASFVSANDVMVNGQRFAGKRIVIATGSRPRKLEVAGIELVDRYTNESIFDISRIPKRFVVVGGGPVGVEIGQAFLRLGSKVTLLQRGDRILPHDDRRVSQVLQERLEAEGMEFIFDAEIETFPDANNAIVKHKDGSRSNLPLDAIFVAIGRVPTVDELNLDRAGIEVKDGRIMHDKYLRTTEPKVYLCGDVAGELMFSHAAEQHMRLLINNFFSPFKKPLDNKHMSWVTFTDPQVATFGLNPEQLEKRNIRYETLTLDLGKDDRAVIESYRYGRSILHVSPGGFLRKERILGGTLIAPHAGELVQELILAMGTGISLDAIFNKIYPYPVASRVNQQIIIEHKKKQLAGPFLSILRFLYRLWN